ncbi:MAG: ABC transporter permease [Ruminococcaceae bacterium]|nr:ABC transporter permease [Oscillospiraceae bacterium]
MRQISKIYTALVMLFLYAPIIVMIVFSFNSSNSLAVMDGFSLGWYKELFRSEEVLNALSNTLVLAVCSAVIATVIGTAAAVGIDRMRSRRVKNVVLGVSNIPMMNPDIVTGISMALLFAFVMTVLGKETILGFWTVLIAHVTFNIPYVILSVLPRIRQMDKHLSEAAMDLGCTKLQSFFKVELPNLTPGIFSGFIMAFTLSLDDFIISYFTAEEFQTLPIVIYGMTKRTVTPDMYALSTLIFGTVLVLLVLSNVMQSRADKQRNGKPQAKIRRIKTRKEEQKA